MWLAQLSALLFLVVALASVAWGIAVTHQSPIPHADLVGSGPGYRPWSGIRTSIAPEWPLISVGLVSISIVTSWAALVARRAYAVAKSLLGLAS